MRLLITGAWQADADELEEIRRMGHTVIRMNYEKDELPCAYDDVEGVIGNALFLHHPIERFTSLRYVQLTSAGLDRMDMDYAQRKKIAVCSASGVYSVPMAEFAVSAAFYFYKQIAFFSENQKRGRWEKHRGLGELFGKTVCIVGCGSVGTECAKRFRAFGCRVLGVNRSPISNECFDDVLAMSELHAAISAADVVVLSVALTEQTRRLMDADAFDVMKQGSVLINIARGGVVDIDALIPHLESGKLYAALDVFETEPLSPEDPVWRLANVYVTPHNSFVGDGNRERLRNVIYKNLELFVK